MSPLLKIIFRLRNGTVSATGFRTNVAALFALNYWLGEFPLSTVANRFDFQSQSKVTDAIVVQNLSVFLAATSFGCCLL